MRPDSDGLRQRRLAGQWPGPEETDGGQRPADRKMLAPQFDSASPTGRNPAMDRL